MVAIQQLLVFSSYWALSLLTKVAYGLRITSIEVPSAVMNSSQAVLVCNYEIQGDQLYSVKWYKNYVEFYRFQPSQSVSDRELQQLGSKQEFELEGINLNLSKSNATHVHLKQTSLSSEGTYKCEISADSPSFATVSSERQMKVYVLPRQKVSIVDNRKFASASTPSDLINLTCISAPARPLAKLRWFINDMPIMESSKWLQLDHPLQVERSPSNRKDQPLESRQTLAFRFLSSNLQTQLMNSNINDKPLSASASKQLAFRCVAEFGLEFVAETSIAVAGGKTAHSKRRNRDQALDNRSMASPLTSQDGGEIDLKPIELVVAVTGGQTAGKVGEPRHLAQSNQTSRQVGVDPIKHLQQQPLQHQQQGVIVLTNKQLRSKAEQIDQMLRLARPNDLQPPLIEARSQLLDLDSIEDAASDDRPELSSSGEDATGRVGPPEGDAVSSLNRVRALSSFGDNSDKDYQLNEVIQFTCSVQPLQLKSDVHFKWLINDKEINYNYINHFDGNRFSLQQTDERLARKKLKLDSNKQNPSSKESNLLVEFTPSLYQLKELDLRCLTSIEQPLIEYETSLLLDAAHNQQTGGLAEIQQSSDDGSHSNPARGQNSVNSNNNNRPWVLRQHSQQRRNQVIRHHKQSSSASFGPFIASGPQVFLLFTLEILVIVVGWTR